jgi:hypothetical protein
MNLSLRPTIIAGEKRPNDYCVIHEGRGVGRIRLADEQSWQGTAWAWHINPPLPVPPWCNGSADSLEVAKDQFKAVWERFYATLTPDDIESWHRTEDLAKANASWLKSKLVPPLENIFGTGLVESAAKGFWEAPSVQLYR